MAPSAPRTEAPTIDNGFRGDASFVHRLEGSGLDYYGRSCYWPGGRSGVTLDPGFDLGYQKPERFKAAYEGLLSAKQMAACLRVLGVRGREAQRRIERSGVLQSIRIAKEDAEALFPRVAAPYWEDVSKNFPDLLREDTPPSVQTVFLSLAYNRGAWNDALDVLHDPLAGRDWGALADAVDDMHEPHWGAGLVRRRDQEADYLRERAELQAKEQQRRERLLAQALRGTGPVEPAQAPLPEITDLFSTVPVPTGAPSSPSNSDSLMTAQEAQDRADNISSLDEAVEVVEEWFDDPEDKRVIVEKLNRAIDVPGIPEQMEGVILSQVLGGVIYAARKLVIA